MNKLMVAGWAGHTLALCSGKAFLPRRVGYSVRGAVGQAEQRTLGRKMSHSGWRGLVSEDRGSGGDPAGLVAMVAGGIALESPDSPRKGLHGASKGRLGLPGQNAPVPVSRTPSASSLQSHHPCVA